MRRLASALLIILLLANAFVYAEENTAKNIANKCTYKASKSGNYSCLYDDRYRNHFETAASKINWIEIQAPEEIYGLYVIWESLPGEWVLQANKNGTWENIAKCGENGYLHEYVKINGAKHIRIYSEKQKAAKLSIFEIEVFNKGKIPSNIQIWQNAPNKIDILVLSAHPDDELMFMGGLIPTYAIDKQVMVAYMTYGIPMRRWELLNGLWHCGLKNYPSIGNFPDAFRKGLKGMYFTWKEELAQKYIVDLIRKYKPDVVVTHDLSGEYGHAAHKACADLCIKAMKLCNKPEYKSDYEPWEVKKLYLHLGNTNNIHMDWTKPREEFGGKSSLQIASEAYGFHKSQKGGRQDYEGQTFFFKVDVGGMFDSSLFSLVYTTVGEDINKNDFLENIH